MDTPDFSKGLLPAVVQDHVSGEVLMLAYMNRESWEETLRTGRACYWSRSRERLWRKGEESGHAQELVEVRVDCDADTILLRVRQIGDAACHLGYRSCFFRRLEDGTWRVDREKLFDPQTVYGRPKQ